MEVIFHGGRLPLSRLPFNPYSVLVRYPQPKFKFGQDLLSG
jgi:hypothetical protein